MIYRILKNNLGEFKAQVSDAPGCWVDYGNLILGEMSPHIFSSKDDAIKHVEHYVKIKNANNSWRIVK